MNEAEIILGERKNDFVIVFQGVAGKVEFGVGAGVGGQIKLRQSAVDSLLLPVILAKLLDVPIDRRAADGWGKG